MIRLNLILLILAVTSAIGTVTSNHRARKMFAEIEHEQLRMRNLEIEWGQLQLEQSTLASHARVEKIAREKLRMKAPGAGQVIIIETAKP